MSSIYFKLERDGVITKEEYPDDIAEKLDTYQTLYDISRVAALEPPGRLQIKIDQYEAALEVAETEERFNGLRKELLKKLKKILHLDRLQEDELKTILPYFPVYSDLYGYFNKLSSAKWSDYGNTTA